MSAKTLILVRHGLTDWNENGRLMGRSATPLNARGREQARQVASAIEGLAVNAIFSSPRARARQTAQPIAEVLGLSVEPRDALDEVWLSESWRGKTVEQLRGDPDLERVIDDPLYETPHLEPVHKVEARIVDCVERIVRDNSAELCVVVSHGDPLRLLIARYLDLERKFFRRLTVDNGSVSVVRLAPHGARLLLNNWRPQLGTLLC